MRSRLFVCLVFAALVASASGCAGSEGSDRTPPTRIVIENQSASTFNLYVDDAFLGRVGPRSTRTFTVPVRYVELGGFVAIYARRLDARGNETNGGGQWNEQVLEPNSVIRLRIPAR